MIDLKTYLMAKKYTDSVIAEGLNVSGLIKTDNVSIGNTNNTLTLMGFLEAQPLTSPVKQGDGTLKWILTETGAIGEVPEGKTIIEIIQEVENKSIQGIKINEIIIPVENNIVEIPLATATTYGLVKSSEDVNNIFISEDGVMTVSSLDVNKLTQTAGEELILDCGKS